MAMGISARRHEVILPSFVSLQKQIHQNSESQNANIYSSTYEMLCLFHHSTGDKLSMNAGKEICTVVS
jgi:hypothetical protein